MKPAPRCSCLPDIWRTPGWRSPARASRKPGRIGFELFDRTNLGASDFAEQVNYRRALEGELERTVATLSEVDQARIHITFAKESVFLDARQPSKATVVLRLKRMRATAAAQRRRHRQSGRQRGRRLAPEVGGHHRCQRTAAEPPARPGRRRGATRRGESRLPPSGGIGTARQDQYRRSGRCSARIASTPASTPIAISPAARRTRRPSMPRNRRS